MSKLATGSNSYKLIFGNKNGNTYRATYYPQSSVNKDKSQLELMHSDGTWEIIANNKDLCFLIETPSDCYKQQRNEATLFFEDCETFIAKQL